MTARRMLPYILLNIVVSAVVVLSLLFWWDSRQPEVTTVPVAPTGSSVVAAPIVVAPNAEGGVVAAPTAAFDEPDPAGPLTYVVQVGDTLGLISQQFDVPLQDILTANGLDNPNFISVGQELIIPINGLPTATPVPEATADVPPTPIATVAADEQATGEEVQVAVSGVIAAGQLENEALTITNLGSRPIALQNWQLVDDAGHEYTFSQVTLFGDGAAILVHTTTGVDGPTDLFWGESEALWAPGATVTLRDSEGVIRASFVVPEA